MKQFFLAAALVLVIVSCKKQSILKEETLPLQVQRTIAANSAKQAPTEMQQLLRLWTQWSYGKPLAMWPFADPDGHLQDLGQCSNCGVYMITGGNLDNPYYTRSITIDLAKYQYIFVGMVSNGGWYDPCDMSFAPKNNQNPEAFFNSTVTQSLNGKRDITLTWDGVNMITSKQQDYRLNSGVFQFPADPSFYEGCSAATSTWYIDGYFAKLPLETGQHTLVFGGSINWKKKYDISALNLVTYHINVIDSSNP